MLSLQLVVGVVAVVLCRHSEAFYRPMPGPYPGGLPRCSSASRPCRLRAVLMESNPQLPEHRQQRRVISNHVCSCPSSSPCPSDWDNHQDNVLVRELRTDGNIKMEFSMMFCNAVGPLQWCSPGDVALRLKGLSSVPTEVDTIFCTCADRRPLELHRRYLGADFYQYDEYVCSMDKRRCNLAWNADTCLIHTPANLTDLFPCKCPPGHVCRPSPSGEHPPKDFRCLPAGQ